jgi:hypothetical protein
MSDTGTVALISAGGSVVIAITALVLNFRLFNSLERRIEIIKADLKQFFRDTSSLERRVSHLEKPIIS